jgi:hypothetical protein
MRPGIPVLLAGEPSGFFSCPVSGEMRESDNLPEKEIFYPVLSIFPFLVAILPNPPAKLLNRWVR